MEKKYYFIIAGIIVVGALIYLLNRQVISPPQQDEQMAVKCGNKTVFRYKYPSKIFPVIINDYATNFNIVSGVLNKLASDSSGNSSVSTEAKNSARQLRDTLDQDNIFFENNLKAYFLASNDDPCNDSLRYMYAAYIKEMTDKVIQLKQFVAQISSSAGSTSTAAAPHDSVLAVVDTAKGKIDSSSKNMAENKIVIKKDYQKLSTAIDQFQNSYKTVRLNKAPSILKINQ